ncbi:DUF2306 domain-containing protein [Paenarthrobacter nicotinovorans]|uniref:DUF2306 domain-containing protein n=1 Tax=Paenarthrobacter nicotinovorans TaxID=29320 RepID=UPI0009A702F0|nr:DUF2306 domain-containing protein [Paenarthrobacter nicotinovorans]MDI2020485.1 hypothetical protein [Paenarthrobacter nicotinovorans]SKC02288.1 Uncharacterized membrane protein [Arthrobacter sp. 31Cvi3.1E]
MPSPWTFLIALHAIAAGYALIFGAVNLLKRNKGTAAHKILGRIWAATMYVVVLTSFGIRTIDGGFNWLHALSLLTFCTLTLGLWSVRKGNIRAHQRFMTGSYFGLIGAFIGVVAVPDRRLPQMAVHDLVGLTLWVAALALTAGLAVAGLTQLRQKTTPGASVRQ